MMTLGLPQCVPVFTRDNLHQTDSLPKYLVLSGSLLECVEQEDLRIKIIDLGEGLLFLVSIVSPNTNFSVAFFGSEAPQNLNVMKIQYMQADQSIGPFIYQMIERGASARDAVCLLSSLHRHCVRDNYAVAISGGTTALISSANDNDTFYYRLKSLLLRKGGSYDGGEAMAGLHVVSGFLFSGGRGNWDAYLGVAAKYAQSKFEDRRYYGPADALENCPETARFIIKTTSASPSILIYLALTTRD